MRESTVATVEENHYNMMVNNISKSDDREK